jgi:2-iminobutanoate/2-iminopropanoate deaminase
MDALKSCLEEAGATLETVLKVTVFLVDEGDFEQMNKIYGRYFAAPFPARTTIVTKLAVADFLFEIEAVAGRAGS